LLSDAFSLAAKAHGSERRPSDGRLFLEHVSEVAGLLHRLEFDEELVAVGLLHDSSTAAARSLTVMPTCSIRWIAMCPMVAVRLRPATIRLSVWTAPLSFWRSLSY
jgi:hypothetical protein